VAQLDAARDGQSAAAPGASVAVADLDCPDLAVGSEVASAHDERGEAAELTGASDPRAALGDQGGRPGSARCGEILQQCGDARASARETRVVS
jgi:hypothetical protein